MSVKTAIRFFPSSHVSGAWMRNNSTTILREHDGKCVKFDYVFDAHSNQVVYDETVRDLIRSVCDGFNVTVVAYGQSGTGKTHSMFGDDDDMGIMPLAFRNLMQIIEDNSSTQYMLKMCVFEVYNEKVYDLLSPYEDSICKLVDSKVIGATEERIASFDQFWKIFKRADGRRKIGETRLNGRSSRSHTIFQLIVESVKVDDITGKQFTTISRLLIADLAGSENSRMANVGLQSTESRNINLSLLAFSKIISATADSSLKVSTFRESKLTRILQPAIGGNSKLLLLCCIRRDDCHETNSTITFAQKAKKIENVVRRNSEWVDAELPKLLEQIAILKKQLEEKEKEEREKEKQAKLELLQNIVLNSNNISNKLETSPIKNRRRHSIGFFTNNRTDSILNDVSKFKNTYTLATIKDVEEIIIPETDSGRCSAEGFYASNGMDTSTEVHAEISKELSEVHDKLHELNSISNAREEMISDLTKRLEIMSSHLARAESKVAELTDLLSHASIAEGLLQVQMQKVSSLNEEIYTLKSASRDKDCEIRDLKESNTVMIQTVGKLENELMSKNKQIEELCCQLEKSKSNCDESKEEKDEFIYWKKKYNDIKEYGIHLLKEEERKRRKAEETLEKERIIYEEEKREIKEKYCSLKCRYKEMTERNARKEIEWQEIKHVIETALKEETAKAKQLEVYYNEAIEEKEVTLNRMTEQTLCFRGTKQFFGKCNNQSHLNLEIRLETLREYNSLLKDRIRDIKYN